MTYLKSGTLWRDRRDYDSSRLVALGMGVMLVALVALCVIGGGK